MGATETAQLLEAVLHYHLEPCATCGRYRLAHDLIWNPEHTVGWCSARCEREFVLEAERTLEAMFEDAQADAGA